MDRKGRTIDRLRGHEQNIRRNRGKTKQPAIIDGVSELVRQGMQRSVTCEALLKAFCDRPNIQHTGRIEAGQWAGDDITNCFGALAMIKQSGFRQPIVQLGQVLDGETSQLEIAPAGQVDLTVAPLARPAGDPFCQRDINDAAGQFQAHD